MSHRARIEEVRVGMRDGVRLAADVYRPEGGRRPTVLLRTPYGRQMLWQRLIEIDPWQAVRKGFAVVLQDVRGRGDSEGDFVLKRLDADDGADTVGWIRRQPWSDGRVVMAGMSYDGIVQFLAAAARPRGLVALAPTMSGEEREIWFWNGALRLHAMTNWVGLVLIREALVSAASGDRAELEDYLDGTPLERFHAIVTPGTAVNRAATPVLDWFDPDPENDYYEQVAIPGDLALPALHTTGWYDVCRPATLTGHARMSGSGAGRQSLLIGPWAHGDDALAPDCDPPPAGLGATIERQLDFFRFALGEEGAEPPPAARTYVLFADRWADHESWPPPGTTTRRWLLAEGETHRTMHGRLLDRLDGHATEVSYEYDPRDPVPTVGGAGTTPGRVGPRDHSTIEQRGDLLTFTTAPLPRELELCGAARVRLPVASSVPATDFVARLTVVKADGRSLNLSEGYWSGFLADLPKLPDKTAGLRECRIDIGPLHALIGPGERLRLHITSSDYPEIYPNPNTGHDPRLGPPGDVRVARQTVFVGCGESASLAVEVRPDA